VLRNSWYGENEFSRQVLGVIEALGEEVRADPMSDFYELQQRLLVTTVGLALVIFPITWVCYSFKTALSALLGAAAGLMYFRLLGKYVADLGVRTSRLSSLRYVVVLIVFLIPIKFQALELMPTFLGFLTFKVAILMDGLRTVYHDLLG